MALAAMGVRAVTIKDVTDVPDIYARELYRAHHENGAPSGQTPSDLAYLTKTRERSFHSAFFVSLYKAARPHTGSRGIAFCHAIQTYWHAMGCPQDFENQKKNPLTPTRANLLSKHVEDGMNSKGAYKPMVCVRKCRICRTVFMGLTDRVENHCDFCIREGATNH